MLITKNRKKEALSRIRKYTRKNMAEVLSPGITKRDAIVIVDHIFDLEQRIDHYYTIIR